MGKIRVCPGPNVDDDRSDIHARSISLFLAGDGPAVGLLGGTLVTLGFSAMPTINYEQIIAKSAGETTLTRSALAERALFKYGSRELDEELHRELVYKEAARRAGIVVTDEEVSKRIDDYRLLLKQYADLPALMGTKYNFDALPRWMLEDQFHTTLCADEGLQCHRHPGRHRHHV